MREDILNVNEYQLNVNSIDFDDEDYYEDIKKAYIKEMMKYPLLKEDEEIYYTSMLNNPEKKKLLVINEKKNIMVSNLNIPLLFYSLENNSSYKMIIDSIIKFYGKLNSNNDKTINILEKYLNESMKYNRALNSKEIYNFFHIDKIDNPLEEKELLYELKEFMNYKFAFDKMFVSNLRLVFSIASHYYGNLDFMDLVNEGNIGLLKAIQKFDTSMEKKFSTYATYWIKMYIRRACISSRSLVKIPEHFLFEMTNFFKKVNKLEQELGRSLSNSEISLYLNIPEDTIEKYNEFMHEDIYLDNAVNEKEDVYLIDTIPSNDSVEEECFNVTIQEDIKKLFYGLTEREIWVIKLYYGLGEYKGYETNTFKIAQLLNLSPQRINQIKMRALFKMKRSSKRINELREMKEYVR